MKNKDPLSHFQNEKTPNVSPHKAHASPVNFLLSFLFYQGPVENQFQ
jgi:hypothetical protein